MLASGVFRRDDRYFTLLRRQASLCRTSAQALWRFTIRDADATSTLGTIETLEEEGWSLASEMESLLSRTVNTPIDREDLQVLASRFGLVLDRTSHAAHACTLLDEVAQSYRQRAEQHVNAMEKLEQAIHALASRAYDEVIVSARDVRRVGADEPSVDEPAGNSRLALLSALVRDRFAALCRATRVSGELVTRVALKHD
jgi:uncharacterized protein Yka (UPF0111/DUF47 family)